MIRSDLKVSDLRLITGKQTYPDTHPTTTITTSMLVTGLVLDKSGIFLAHYIHELLLACVKSQVYLCVLLASSLHNK